MLLHLLFSVVLMGCTQPAQSPPSTHLRLISLIPAITETIFALKGQEHLIGRSDYCLYPESTQSLPSFGTSLTPNLESIAVAAPDDILIDASLSTPKSDLKQISTVTELPWLTVDEVSSSILRIGEMLKRPEQATKLSQQLVKGLAPTTSPTSPTAIAIMSGSDIEKGQIWYLRSDSLHGSAVEAAGFRNAAPRDINGPPSMSLEALIAINPDVVLFIGTDDFNEQSAQKTIDSINKVSALTAVKKQQVVVIFGSNLLGVGPGILQLVSELKTKHQQLFKDN